MIADVIGSYLDSLEEREFDAPFMALLRSLGYRDIHFLHGTFEFGKDFIAKRDEGSAVVQYSFQTKAGNIGLAEWKRAGARSTCSEPIPSRIRRSTAPCSGRLCSSQPAVSWAGRP